MKFFSSEIAHDYGTYTFAYANYCRVEEGDRLSEAYALGYLPYSGSQGEPRVFYMARSARIALPEFTFSSENRRIAKRFDGRFDRKRTPLSEFAISAAFIDFCLVYFATLHGDRTMPKERLMHILDSGLITHVVTYEKDGVPAAYVLEIEHGDMAHYWFSFYDPSYARQSLGMWLMLDCARDARERKLQHYYVGTVYGEKALYKTNFEQLQWWNGGEWSHDLKGLRERGRSDADRTFAHVDEWKTGTQMF